LQAKLACSSPFLPRPLSLALKEHEDFQESCSSGVNLSEAVPFVVAFVPALGCSLCAASAIILFCRNCMKPDADDRDVKLPLLWLALYCGTLGAGFVLLWLQHGNEQTEKAEPVMRL
jgi:hypothetical protein